MVQIYELEKYKKETLVSVAPAMGSRGKLLFFTGVRYERLDAQKATSHTLKTLSPVKTLLQGNNTNLMMQ